MPTFKEDPSPAMKSGFKMRSGNSPLFKQMGSSPVKHDVGVASPEEHKFSSDEDRGKFHTEVIDGHYHESEDNPNTVERRPGDSGLKTTTGVNHIHDDGTIHDKDGNDKGTVEEEEEDTMLTKKYKK